MERCKCGLAGELTRHDVEVSYRGLIRCVCERPLMAWDGLFYYTIKRVSEITLPITKVDDALVVHDTVTPALRFPQPHRKHLP
jgi:hypothetical protein